ncbi:protein of unknown function [Candidatus Nitrosocosmicus franklandus]|uniref:Uncharacterized protein n=1 Tax=Candidatus Nitrosocosmicus franklandianus TaxID=1798806 RepID=A0A484I6K4_9ARCH|nr:protein of unknown function [Candidatus Nitrosocosmicus franklandus]
MSQSSSLYSIQTSFDRMFEICHDYSSIGLSECVTSREIIWSQSIQQIVLVNSY